MERVYSIVIDIDCGVPNGIIGIINQQLLVYADRILPFNMPPVLGVCRDIVVTKEKIMCNLVTQNKDFIRLYNMHKDKIKFTMQEIVVAYGVIDAQYIQATINVDQVIQEIEGCCAV